MKGGTYLWKAKGTSMKSKLESVGPFQEFGWTGVTFGGSAIHIWYLEKTEHGTLVKVERKYGRLAGRTLQKQYEQRPGKGHGALAGKAENGK